MAHVAALYRGVRFADTEAADDAWSRKTGMVALAAEFTSVIA